MVELRGDQASAAMLSEQRLPSAKESKGGLMAQGIGSIISSMFNMVPVISGSANIGLCSITGVTSRYVVSIAGAVFAVFFAEPICDIIAATVKTIIFMVGACQDF